MNSIKNGCINGVVDDVVDCVDDGRGAHGVLKLHLDNVAEPSGYPVAFWGSALGLAGAWRALRAMATTYANSCNSGFIFSRIALTCFNSS